MERLDQYISQLWVPTANGQNLTFKELESGRDMKRFSLIGFFSARGSINFLFHAFKVCYYGI